MKTTALAALLAATALTASAQASAASQAAPQGVEKKATDGKTSTKDCATAQKVSNTKGKKIAKKKPAPKAAA